MQDLSYFFPNMEFELGDFRFSVMLYTHTNAYSLDPKTIVCHREEERLIADGSRLLCFGGQRCADGSVHIEAALSSNEISIQIRGEVHEIAEEIRSVKLCVYGLSAGEIVNLIDARPRKIPDQGLRFQYPEGWRDAGTPLVIMNQPDGRYLYFRSADEQVRQKTFVFSERNSELYAELIFEELATEMSNHISVPRWEIGFTSSLEKISQKHLDHIKAAYRLQDWESREDVPAWAREVSLIAAIHGQHWTGYIFNDYEKILLTLERLCKKIEPKRILAFLPGWEGRYYWQYGAYGPDERMGGAKGFHRLCDGAKDLGVHLMPMFGINIVGVHHAGFAAWGDPCELRTGAGNINRTSVDWDGSRHFDHSSNRTLNPGAPKWQNRLVQQITSLADEYGFDGAFLDIAAGWANDPNHNVYDGVCQLTKRIKENRPEFLLAGEGWYDGLAACIPLLQCGHTDGKLHWHDEAYAPMFDTFARNFGHLCLGDPSRFSTGVHEQGYNSEWRTPFRKGVIPTLTIVDGTLENAEGKVKEILQDAEHYAKEFIIK